MKVSYDNEVDALYIELSAVSPSGVVEMREGVNLDVAEDGKVIGIEILEASTKVALESFLSYELSPDFLRRAG